AATRSCVCRVPCGPRQGGRADRLTVAVRFALFAEATLAFLGPGDPTAAGPLAIRALAQPDQPGRRSANSGFPCRPDKVVLDIPHHQIYFLNVSLNSFKDLPAHQVLTRCPVCADELR